MAAKVNIETGGNGYRRIWIDGKQLEPVRSISVHTEHGQPSIVTVALIVPEIEFSKPSETP